MGETRGQKLPWSLGRGESSVLLKGGSGLREWRPSFPEPPALRILELRGHSHTLFPHEHAVADQWVLAAFGRDEVYGVIVEKPHLKAGMVAVLHHVNGAILRNDAEHRLCRFVRVLAAIMALQVLAKYLPGMRALEESAILLREFEAVKLVCVPIRKQEIGLARPNSYHVRIWRPGGLLLGSRLRA